jgi:hypothetical protein
LSGKIIPKKVGSQGHVPETLESPEAQAKGLKKETNGKIHKKKGCELVRLNISPLEYIYTWILSVLNILHALGRFLPEAI